MSHQALALLKPKQCAPRSALELALFKQDAVHASALKVSILKEEIVNRDVLDRARQHLELEGQVDQNLSIRLPALPYRSSFVVRIKSEYTLHCLVAIGEAAERRSEAAEQTRP
jgi:hypothetical protein